PPTTQAPAAAVVVEATAEPAGDVWADATAEIAVKVTAQITEHAPGQGAEQAAAPGPPRDDAP
ncbi:hypothetical protein, partial [Actinomadura soli]|uniref:hypothetical protein n=1 Tax=Actinomadura soli TaxID=2508997 RepID=UPI00197AC6F7